MDTYVDLSAEFGGKGAEARGAVLSPKVNERGLAWLDQPHDRPFFLFLHYFDIHYDYVPPAPYDRMFDPDYTGTMDGRRFIERPDVNAKMPARDLEHIRALYDGEIRFVDEHVGKVLARLDEKGLGDSTVVLIVADHGEEFFEHGNKGHHRTVYDEVLRIPLAIRLPRGEVAGRQVPGQASLLDIFPTILDAAGIAAPPEAEGESLLGWLRGATSTREAVFSDFYDKRGFNLQVSRRTPTNKTIEHFNRITHPKQAGVEHYDLAADPAEKTDLAPSRPEAMVSSLDRLNEWLDARWQAHRSVEAAGGSSASLTMDAETMQKLKSLGYVGN
jgi:arylsulfatase A-like enzyme